MKMMEMEMTTLAVNGKGEDYKQTMSVTMTIIPEIRTPRR